MKQLKEVMFITLMSAAVLCVGVNFASADERNGAPTDTAPGPAYTTVDGKITKIEGPVYTIESEPSNYQNLGTNKNVTEVKIYVSKETKQLRGNKKVRDKVRAEVTSGGFANSVQ